MPTATMKALRKMRPEQGAQLEVVPVPTIGPTDVLVRVRAASICGTVERVGEEVTAVTPGDFVSAEMHLNCGHCHQCRVGQLHLCQSLRIIGIDLDGCFAEFVRIPASNIWKVDPAIPEHYAAILDPLGNAVHTVLSGEIVGQTVAVTGCGPIGLMAIATAKACGCSTVLATEVNPHRRALALRMGATEALNPAETDVVEWVRQATGGVGVDVLLEMSGHPTAIQQGLRMLRAGGRASLLGIPSEPVTLDLVNDVIFKGATIQGIYGRRMFRTWLQMTALIKAGRLNLEPLFGERLGLDRFADAFSMMQGGLVGKILFYPNGTPR